MKRPIGVALLACALAAGCAEDATQPSDAAVVATSADASASTVDSTTPTVTPETVAPPSGDFGSRYNGSPVAFWFWAPY
ncbi:MAG: hypothetical protein FGM42_10745 [Ilumatobacteraceae bacterium]|nr:hypothetical protein [Ilumatobacteraceae bacterium]